MISIHISVSASAIISHNALIIDEKAQYPSVRKRIYKALEDNQNLEVIVRTRICDEWFWDLSDYHQDVRIINDSPEELLKRKLSIDALPPDLKDNSDLIIHLQLLELPLSKDGENDVWGWILRSRLGEIWEIEDPSVCHLTQLVNWYANNKVQHLLQFKVEERISCWIQKAQNPLKSAYARFFENPTNNAILIITSKSMSVYPKKLKEKWLIDQELYSPKYEDIVEMIDFPTSLPLVIQRKFDPILQTYWNTQFKDLFND
jgi:hypothetical protein